MRIKDKLLYCPLLMVRAILIPEVRILYMYVTLHLVWHDVTFCLYNPVCRGSSRSSGNPRQAKTRGTEGCKVSAVNGIEGGSSNRRQSQNCTGHCRCSKYSVSVYKYSTTWLYWLVCPLFTRLEYQREMSVLRYCLLIKWKKLLLFSKDMWRYVHERVHTHVYKYAQ